MRQAAGTDSDARWGDDDVSDDRLDDWRRLLDQGESLVRDASSAARAGAATGRDETGSVRVVLDADGRVAAVNVAAAWRRRLGEKGLSEAVLEAVRDAAVRRLEAWGEAYGAGGDDQLGERSGDAGDRPGVDPGDLQRRLREVATGPMSESDRRVALTELLELAEAIERGLDEVSGRLRATLAATHTGQSADRHVTVTVTGGGEVTAVRLSRTWLRQAHEANIGRQITAAFRAAYERTAAHSVDKLISDSPLGEIQRAAQDPLGLARRLRLSD